MTGVVTLSGEDLVRLRLRNHQLARTASSRPSDIVAWLGAVQAQDYGGAKWALALRGRRLTGDAVEHAVNDGDILRTHVLRPTWHFVTPADIRWMLALTGPRVKAAMAYRDRVLELDERTFARATRAIERALRDGCHLTRPEVGAALHRAGVATDGQRLAHIVARAELDAVICSGPRRGNQFTYALLEERVPRAAILRGDEALAELTLRYFRSHGPATPRDYAWWSGLTIREAKRGIDMLGRRLSRLAIGDGTYWAATGRTRASGPTHTAHLLPNYDEYLVAYTDRHALGYDTPRTASGRADFFSHTVLIDGRVAGSWTRILRKAVVEILLSPSFPWRADDVARVEAATQRYASFVRLAAVVTKS